MKLQQKVINAAFFLLYAGGSICSGQSIWVDRGVIDIKLRSITYGNGVYVAVGDKGMTVVSRDGVQWTIRPLYINEPIYCVNYCGKTFVAGSVDTLYSSGNGLNWSNGHVIGSRRVTSLTSVAYGDSETVIIGKSSSNNYPSSLNWVSINAFHAYLPFDFHACGVYGLKPVSIVSGYLYIGPDRYQQFVAVGDAGTVIVSQIAGLCFSTATAAEYNFNSIAYGNGKYVAMASPEKWDTSAISGPGKTWFLTTTDPFLRSWTKTDSINGYYCYVSFYSGRFIVVGYNGTVALSTDGIIWNKKKIFTSRHLNSVTWGPAPSTGQWQFVAVGDRGLIATSIDDNSVAINQKNITGEKTQKMSVAISGSRILVTLNPGFHGPVAVQLFNISGKKVSDLYCAPENGLLRVPVSGVAAGVYQLVVAGKGCKFAKVITITR